MVLIAQEVQTEDETMKVKELIEKLQEMDQEAVVNCYDGYDPYFGDKWSVCSSVEQDIIRWDTPTDQCVYEVFIQ